MLKDDKREESEKTMNLFTKLQTIKSIKNNLPSKLENPTKNIRVVLLEILRNPTKIHKKYSSSFTRKS